MFCVLSTSTFILPPRIFHYPIASVILLRRVTCYVSCIWEILVLLICHWGINLQGYSGKAKCCFWNPVPFGGIAMDLLNSIYWTKQVGEDLLLVNFANLEGSYKYPCLTMWNFYRLWDLSYLKNLLKPTRRVMLYNDIISVITFAWKLAITRNLTVERFLSIQ